MDSVKMQPENTDNYDLEISNLSLHQGARYLDEASMRELIQHVANKTGKFISSFINSHDTDQLSPLHYAAKSNCLEVVKLLVDNGADVNDKGADGDTPLHYAARYRRHKKKPETMAAGKDTIINVAEETRAVMDFLLAKRKSRGKPNTTPNPNEPNKYGQRPLHFAAMRGNKAAAQYFLSRKDIDIEIPDNDGLTPLHVASIYSQTKIADMLIKAGANLNCLTKEKSNPLHLACAEGHVSVVSLLLRKAGSEVKQMVDAVDSEGYTCLHHATDNSYYEITEMCLDKGADVNCRTHSKLYPLHLAAAAGDAASVKMLLNHGAKIDALTDDQATPLHRAAMYNHTDVMKELLDYSDQSKLLVHKRDADGYTPFLLAAVYGHKDTLQILYDCSHHVTSATEKNDKNALHLAAEENKSDALKFLLSKKEFGQKVMRAGDRYASEPLHLAAREGCFEAVKILLEHGADIGKNEDEKTPVHLAAMYGWKEIARIIVQAYPRSINDEDEDSNTPLHLASLNGQHETVELLINLEGEVTCRNSAQWTPLDCAASNGWVKTARILIENDAPVDCMDKAMTTPLHLAAQHGHVNMVDELLKSAANASYRNDKGNNALDLAIEHNNKDCALAIINSDQWKNALRNQNLYNHRITMGCTRNTRACDRDTPMRKLIRQMPEVAEMVFNKCMKLPEKPSLENADGSLKSVHEDPDDTFEVEFLYEFLEDAYSVWDDDDKAPPYDNNGYLYPNAVPYVYDGRILEKNHCLNIMVMSNREELLLHPLVLSLLQYKWNRLVRYVYTMNTAIYAVFLTFLTGFVVLSVPPYTYGNCQAAIAIGNETPNTFSIIGKYVILLLAIAHMFKEILQMYLSKLAYIGMGNLIEWVVYIFSMLVVIDFNDCQKETGLRETWQWQIAAIAIFLAWVNLVLFIQKLPAFGIYVVMFTVILKTFIQFFVVFALFIIAFGLGFYVLLQNQDPFSSVFESLIKTSVMMIGEFDYTDIFYGITYYKEVSYLMFMAFTTIMSILIMNLLVGLAVDDIKAVQEKAEMKRIAMQVELALDIDRVVPECIRRRFIKQSVKMDLNAGVLTRLRECMHFAGRSALTPDSVMEAMNPELTDMKRLERSQDKLHQKMEESLQEINSKIEKLQSLDSKMDRILEAVNRPQNVSTEDET